MIPMCDQAARYCLRFITDSGSPCHAWRQTSASVEPSRAAQGRYPARVPGLGRLAGGWLPNWLQSAANGGEL